MLLERLREYADDRIPTPPPMYQDQPIRYVIALAADGTFLDLIDTADPSSPATKRGARRLTPYVKRTMGIRPRLLADNAAYVLGHVSGDKPERIGEQHQHFVDLVRQCATVTREPTVLTIANALEHEFIETIDLPSNFDPIANITFRVGETYPIDLPSVRDFWADLQTAGEGKSSAKVMTCIVCGNQRPILERHPFKIKGIPGGQVVKDLISANAAAFESYGLAASETAPTCQTCAEAYGNALNHLLADPATSLRAHGTAYAFWTRTPTPWNPVRMLTEPEEQQDEVRSLLSAWRTGKDQVIGIDANRFYAVGLGASGSRVVVRDWIDTTVAEAQARMGRYFALQEMVDAWGAQWTPLSARLLLSGLVRERSGDDAPPIAMHSLTRLALTGAPLPMEVLFLAVRRNRAEQDVSRERATLIKMVLVSQPDVPGRDEHTMSDLETTSTEPAYLCGRLLAVLDVIQSRAIGNPNATIVDKFYGSASSAPASVFGTLLHGAQAHMSKLHRDQPGMHYRLQETLESITEPLMAFPKTLTLEQQALFALGFYHQRAADRRAAKERKEERARTVPSTTDPGTAENLALS